MKYLALFLALLFTQRPLFAQSCQPVQVATTAQQKEALRKYIKECNQKRFFSEGKGVVKLIIFQDAEGLTNWHLIALLDDSYRSFPPAQYAYFEDRVILIYQGNQNARYLPIEGDEASRNACIQDIVGSRVAKYSPKQRFVSKQDATGKVNQVPVRDFLYGNLNNEVVIRFNKDGTITEFAIG